VTEDRPAREVPSTQKIDTTVPHSARIWNYWLGGKDHYPVDREAGDTYREIYPGIVDTARAVRYFMAHVAAGESYAETGAVPYQLRSVEEIAGFFAGLDLMPPGIVPVPEWRPDPAPFPAVHVDTLGGVARKPGEP
jgi:hypothetical protein